MPRVKKAENESKPNVYGYLRVSTEKQDLDNNKILIEKKKNELNLGGEIIWVEEKISGAVDWNKRELGKLVNETVKPGDTIIMSELSRISRIGVGIQEFVSVATKNKINVYACDMPVKLDDSMSCLMWLNCLSMGAQMERERIKERTKIALEKKKMEGMQLGRPKGSMNKNNKLEPNKAQITSMVAMGIPYKRIAEQFKVTPQLVSSYVKKNNLKPKKMPEIEKKQ